MQKTWFDHAITVSLSLVDDTGGGYQVQWGMISNARGIFSDIFQFTSLMILKDKEHFKLADRVRLVLFN